MSDLECIVCLESIDLKDLLKLCSCTPMRRYPKSQQNHVWHTASFTLDMGFSSSNETDSVIDHAGIPEEDVLRLMLEDMRRMMPECPNADRDDSLSTEIIGCGFSCDSIVPRTMDNVVSVSVAIDRHAELSPDEIEHVLFGDD